MGKFKAFIVLLFAALATITYWSSCARKIPDVKNCTSIARQPDIFPDYTETTLPPNIAPTNFIIQEKGDSYYVHISSVKGKAITLYSRSPKISIPIKPWKELLSQNCGDSLCMTIFVKDEMDAWKCFKPIENYIARENIDTHLVYRFMRPLYMYWDKMSINQRDLTCFDERTIAFNKSLGNNCINCHSFHNYNPDRMILHMRAGTVGTSMILVYDGDVLKVDTKTSFNPPTAYRSWHPNGEVIAFSYNVVMQFFHATGENRDVYDKASDLLLYNIGTNTITTSPKIVTSNRMETYPEWSPDGKYLYFCSAPRLESYDPHEHPYRKIKYDLMRISYAVGNDSWGEVEPVLLASELGLSVAHPKISPDGKYILFCMAEYGNFTIYNPSSDLYILDTQTKEFSKAEILNSNQSESYHCWASNGRWIVFSSKREDNVCTYAYFSYFDTEGYFRKPFILPQKDPRIYQDLFQIYNVPEFVNGPVKIRPQKLKNVAWSKQIIKAKLDIKVEKKADSQTEELLYNAVPQK
jgi:hypothetical protein